MIPETAPIRPIVAGERVDADGQGQDSRRCRNAVVLMCMEEAGFIAGQTIHVDGGVSVMDSVFPLEVQRG